MIYKKEANFPYPVLTNRSNSYDNCEFILDVVLKENTDSYRFEIEYDITSTFIEKLINNGQAKLVIVVQSKDNKFFNIEPDNRVLDIPKSRISLNKRTTLQLLVQGKERITFKDNEDLNEFYRDFKSDIVVNKHSVLGFSNTVIFDGSSVKPLELFEKKLNPKLKSDIKIELGSENIIINYKSEEIQFANMASSTNLNNPYIYMGLQKALHRFVVNNGSGQEDLYLDEIEEPSDMLDLKLYNLMNTKMVEELNYDNIDEVIHLISNGIIEKYVSTIRGYIR